MNMVPEKSLRESSSETGGSESGSEISEDNLTSQT